MIELFIISFAGFTSENDPDIKFIDTEKDGHDEIMVRPCIISLPNSSLSSASVATKCANAIMERLIKIQEPKPAGATISVNMIGVSESCGVIRFMLNNTLDTPINAVVVSACFDRARTSFGSPFSITPSPSLETSLNPTPPPGSTGGGSRSITATTYLFVMEHKISILRPRSWTRGGFSYEPCQSEERT